MKRCRNKITITCEIPQTIELSCGLSHEAKTLTFAEDETVRVSFALSE